MPSYLDLALLAIVTISGLLAMVRGFTREVLAIASWGAAAIAAYYFYPLVLPFVKPYLAKEAVALIASVAAVFFVTLILVSIVTVKLSEAILDSKVGALDRTLGFVFGAARGFLLGVVAFQFLNWLAPKAQPEWIASAKSRPLLQEAGDGLVAMLPENLDTYFKRFTQPKAAPAEDVPADDSEPTAGSSGKPAPAATAQPGKRGEAAPPAAVKPVAAAPAALDKQGMNALLGKVGTGPLKPNDKKQ